MTHAQWQARLQRDLAFVARDPSRGLARLQRLLQRLEAEARLQVGDWHIDQTLQAISTVQSDADDHQRSAQTMSLLAGRFEQRVVYYERAFVAAWAAAALELAEAGDRTAALRALRAARPVARRLRPQERLYRLAHVRVAAMRNSRTPPTRP